MEFENLAGKLKALSEPTRLKIIGLLKVRDCCVCELVPVFGISQPAISKHMFRLKSAGLVKEERRGKWVFYSLNKEAFKELGFDLSVLPDLTNELKAIEDQGSSVQCNILEQA
ncbi:ArsR family transcriptional regulator [Melghiribacillus thermohalophilus]|uniref:ArsR family transcriptional regulator n=1 Tax=Melghiribacillus thermohalophilus TaxID=1324956 RepID=A0A4R3MZ66_9BACI|nr:metalloregulator ArsR/SmtB family transcription factor [Melghiribacillus thermohalophilus]TCT20906.1 ArsR family transcriptional regulator [Melghiribacillus thermohalophilus]